MAWIKRKNSFQQASTIIVALFPLLLLIELAKCISKRSWVDSACTWDGFPTFHQQPNYSWNNKTQHKKNNYKKGVSPKATVHTKNPIICEFRKINKKHINKFLSEHNWKQNHQNAWLKGNSVDHFCLHQQPYELYIDQNL